MSTIQQIPRLHIVGRKNAGKTTLVCELVAELTRQGYRVATIKHTHHHHELDTPGKDSHQHREAGAVGVGILSSQMTAVFVPVRRNENEATRYSRFNVMFHDCDIILVEGDLHATAKKLEVWRPVVGELPYATTDESILAVVSDDQVSVTCDRLKRSELPQVVNWVVRRFRMETPRQTDDASSTARLPPQTT